MSENITLSSHYYHRKKDSYLKCTLHFSVWQTAAVSDADVGFLPQGVKAVLAESYERIHRSNLVGMGVIPLEYLPGDSAESLGLSGRERFSVIIPPQITPRMTVHIKVERQLSLKSAMLSWFLFRKHLTSSDQPIHITDHIHIASGHQIALLLT